ncbi:alpha-protein kinase 1 isoform X1 [Hypanus sabinus]|uniref:alpha-protein kinase 1 isoform X1 n=1 Tax=Hypanus sabinus TaxID=79690 RepID=UPI0028C441FA|nr:alpha-protein kinase 1 isoform X1 [Hypanus sabinus]XP_059820886.1 alpha-protein kinase 1 isoform X1 [Hypanus sabinus]XP_059820887.1 alpha-protein kinase 1 isoform X1 [Hypanus sabinus]XP_059820888.1 alpha-protein kinase 1 isoform X1 [Hypanus sabinus]XP_059820889.1 alpha-protein kinase 1 isoform X1 [Hypanus sabinus]
MNNQEMVALLQECKQALDAPPSEPSEEDKTKYQQCEASLSADLRTLLEQAKEMKWPFVPERWQYKQEVCPEDKTNLKDIISKKLPNLLVFLKASVSVGDYASAAATVFLIDRFLYWVDASSKLLQVAKGLHKRCMEIPIAPQVVIRQARVSVNSGKLLKAEYILSSLIIHSGATGTWVYEKKSDRTLVQAVSVQIRGQILQKLGLWYEAAEMIWASIVGFNELPQPDKKGISTSLGILADLLVSMSDEDYYHFKKNPQMDLILVEECTDRLLSAAEASKLAAVLSQYNPLYVLTNLNIYGTCLLSYSFKGNDSKEKSQFYLLQAKEAFEIGLLTKRDDDVITSKQELHGFVKAAFSLTTVHKWLTGNSEILVKMRQLCKEAMRKLYLYSTQNQEVLAQEIMELTSQIKVSLQIKDLCNSDSKSYVPDHYKHYWDKPIVKRSMAFDEILARHKQYHRTICTVFEGTCRRQQNSKGLSKYSCITAFKTETKEFDTANAKASISHQCDLDASQHSLPKEMKAIQNKQEMHNKRHELMKVAKPENQHANPLKDHTCSRNDQPHGTDRNLGGVTLKDKGNTKKGCSDHLSDCHDFSSSSKSCLEKSGSGLSDSWEEVINSKDSGSPSSGSKPHPLTVDTECSTVLTEEIREHQQDDLEKHTALSVFPSEHTLSQTHKQLSDSNINCTPGNMEKKIPSALSSVEHRSSTVAGPDGKTVDDNAEDHEPDSYVETTGHNQRCESTCQTSITHSDSTNLRKVSSSSSFEMIDSDADTVDDREKDNKTNNFIGSPGYAPNPHSSSGPTGKGTITHSDSLNIRKVTSASLGESNSFEMIDTDAETADDIQNDLNDFHMGTSENSLMKSSYSQPRPNAVESVIIDSDNSGSLAKRSQMISKKNRSVELISVDPTAETVEETEESHFPPIPQGASESQHSDESKKQETHHHDAVQMKDCSAQSMLPVKELDKDHCKASLIAAESADDVVSNQSLNSSVNSSSSNRSWCKSLFSSSGSDLEYISSPLSSSSSSFVFLSKKVQSIKKRVITDEDYKMLCAGVTHKWLLERITGTGVFYPHKLKDIYRGLLFKYNKKTDTWTAQETLVYTGKCLVVDKPGAQRTALETRFLHQEEILGRYVGKQYKRAKELSYYFNDVERQMTAQHYVTVFNKRLYEQQVPTQIYYIPASVLLLLEDNQIVDCVSVEPYMLGKFIKLTNNKKAVCKEYEATMYGLAFGHFTYEFSNQEEIVVDLQGWVTGDGKGLIYLTDPQIHSVTKQRGGSNFADQGIRYFFNCQHKECNEICHILTLKNPGRDNLEEITSA